MQQCNKIHHQYHHKKKHNRNNNNNNSHRRKWENMNPWRNYDTGESELECEQRVYCLDVQHVLAQFFRVTTNNMKNNV